MQSEPAMPHLIVNGARLYYEERGNSAQAVIFAHGLLWLFSHFCVTSKRGYYTCSRQLTISSSGKIGRRARVNGSARRLGLHTPGASITATSAANGS